jgi:hypothetical protein
MRERDRAQSPVQSLTALAANDGLGHGDTTGVAGLHPVIQPEIVFGPNHSTPPAPHTFTIQRSFKEQS